MTTVAGSPVGPPAEAAPRTPDRRGIDVLVALAAVLVVITHLAAAFLRSGWLWGVDAAAFLPRSVLIGTVVACAALGALAWRFPVAAGRPKSPADHTPVALLVAVVALAGVVFWVFRVRHVLLGDGVPMTALLPTDHAIHPREPLSGLVQQWLYHALAPTFARSGLSSRRVVQDCVAVGSVVAGMLFVGTAALLGRELTRSAPPDSAERAWPLAWAVALVLVAQGYVLLFFGYVENYAYPSVVAALYLLAALRFLRGAGRSILLPLGLAALGVAFDLTGLVLGPSALVLVAAGLRDPSRRGRVARELALLVALGGAAAAALAWGPAHYPVFGHIGAMLASGHARADYLLSAAHSRDFVNEHALIGPVGVLLFAPLAVLFLRDPRGAGTVAWFLIVAGASVSLACFGTPDLPMGYARDWDLFGPLGVVVTFATLGLVLSAVRTPSARWKAIATLGVVSLFHTVPWIALNASEARSVERFASLPLGHGRTESTLAFWYAERGRYAEARSWLRRSLAADPANTRAMDLYGRIALAEGHADLALKSYLVAVALRPDKPDYRLQLATAVRAAGSADPGLRQVDTLMVGREDDGALWLDRALLLGAAGRVPEARDAWRRALRARPDLAAYPDRLPIVTAAPAGTPE